MNLQVALYDWYDNYSRRRIDEEEYNYKRMFERAIKKHKRFRSTNFILST